MTSKAAAQHERHKLVVELEIDAELKREIRLDKDARRETMVLVLL